MEIVSIVTSDTNKTEPIKNIFCYYTNWSQYRAEPAKFQPRDIVPQLCTHIIFAFANVDEIIKTAEHNDEDLYKEVLKLKNTVPTLKVLLAIGGWSAASKPFTNIVEKLEGRRRFITHSLSFLRHHGFDGLDIDWEYPANRGSPPEDREMFTQLLKEFRYAFDVEGSINSADSKLMLTAAVGVGRLVSYTAYEVEKISHYLDFISLMTYDLHGPWDGKLGLHSPLYGTSADDEFSQDWAVKDWIRRGAPREKLNLGLPFYGRSFAICSSAEVNVGDRSCASGLPGKYTNTAGTLSYYEICPNFDKGWTRHWQENQKTPYLHNVNQKQWIGYEDQDSIGIKTQYAKEMKLAGVMVWSLDFDDFNAVCDTRYPLLRRVNEVLNGNMYMPNWYNDVDDDIKSEKRIEVLIMRIVLCCVCLIVFVVVWAIICRKKSNRMALRKGCQESLDDTQGCMRRLYNSIKYKLWVSCCCSQLYMTKEKKKPKPEPRARVHSIQSDMSDSSYATISTVMENKYDVPKSLKYVEVNFPKVDKKDTLKEVDEVNKLKAQNSVVYSQILHANRPHKHQLEIYPEYVNTSEI
ncbi:unnamed protein product [Owenia fusiformis]|uniref:Uncharacterized protein n=1 Tax=Owenia fusiformis TaxID=6347 RepID=A0A8J1U057_OWEFU|nr:unnamed protein product [Owenia fusiformis]